MVQNNTLSKNYKVSTPVAILSLVICLLILAFAFQGSRGVWQPDEGYYVGTAVTMLDRGNIIIPYLGEDIFLEKPPMIYWGIIGGLKLFGHNEFAVRVFHALCYVFTVLTVGLLGRTLFKSMIHGIAAGVIYATMAIPFVAANFVTPDTPLALWTTVAVLLFWKSIEPNASHVTVWKMLMCLAIGLGFLTKGPAVLIPFAGMFVFLLVRRQTIKYFFTPWILVGFVIFCAAGLGWYAYIAYKVPGAGAYFFDNQIWGRLVSKKYNRNPGMMGALIYIPVLLFGSLPWSSVWLEKRKQLSSILKKSWWTELKNRPVALFLLCWFFVPVAILSLASSKLSLYPLPVFPAMALALTPLWVRKIPASLLEKKEKFNLPIKPIALICIWIVILLGTKFALGHYPADKDGRALWAAMKSYIPEGNYEIVTIDERADGLIFYGAKNVEHVTQKDDPYPTFAITETVLSELKDIPVNKYPHLFLIKGYKHLEQMRAVFTEKTVLYKEIKLPYDRYLLICDAAPKTE
jgi:4-amino-4-deoxy-L-arabinose transferase-like glycosyltransferase